MNTSGRTLKKLSWALAASSLFFAGSALAQQASINLVGSTINYCNAVHNTWDVSKVVALDGDTNPGTTSLDVNAPSASVVWSISATKNPGPGPAPAAVFCVEGSLTINNAGSAPATVGNIVVNAQRMISVSGKKRWVSVGADISTKTSPLGATSANVVKSVTAEDAGWNLTAFTAGDIPSHNYTAGTQVGTFTKGPGSGVITFSGPQWQGIFDTSYTVPGNQTVTLTYQATFDSASLGIDPAGDHLRTEILVTFGNAGARGGSGASIGVATGIPGGVDIDMDGKACLTGDADECNVRTVPIRASLDVPPVDYCNQTVSIDDVLGGDGSDGGIIYTVTDASAGITGSDTCLADSNAPCNMSITSNASGTWTLATNLALLNGSGDHTISNSVHLVGHHINFNQLEEPDTICCETEDKNASATVTLHAGTVICIPGSGNPLCACGTPGQEPCPTGFEFCTYTRGKLNARSNNPLTTLVANNWGTTLFPMPNGLVFGQGSATDNAPTWAGKYVTQNLVDDDSNILTPPVWMGQELGSLAKLRQILTNNCPGCQTGSLNADAGTNPFTSGSSNQVAQTLMLMVGRELSSTGLSGPNGVGLGDVVVCPNGTMPFCTVTTYTISQLIDISNTILAGANTGPNPPYPGWSGTAITNLLDAINNAFDDCSQQNPVWIQQYTNVPLAQ